MPELVQSVISRLSIAASSPVEVVVELLLIALTIHWCATVLQGTRGTRPVRGLLVMLLIVTLGVRVASVQLGWARLELLYQYFVFGLAFIALVAFQPELRRAVIRAGDIRFLRRGTPQAKLISALVKAAGYLSKNRHGALLAIERTINLQGWAENGTLIGADVSANLLNNIFFPNSPLHDLGVIIRNNRIAAANCQFPMAESDEIDASLGSRHLAALAMSYESDALVLVVSEETGTISIADDGKLIRFLSLDDLTDELGQRLGNHSGQRRDSSKRFALVRRGWRVFRHGILVTLLTLTVWYLADQASSEVVEGVRVRLVPQDPERIVDVVRPTDGDFSITFRGPNRSTERMRGGELVTYTWNIPPETRQGDHTLPAREIIANLPEVRKAGLAVIETKPEILHFGVQERRDIELSVVADSGPIEISEFVATPPTVSFSMGAVDYDAIEEPERVIRLPLQERLATVPQDQTVTIRDVPVPTQLGDHPIAPKPSTVDVTLRIVGQRVTRRIGGVNARLFVPPAILERYRPEVRDDNEFLLELAVEGDKRTVEALEPMSIRAIVAVDSTLTTEFRPVEVQVILPPGVTLVGPPPAVQVRLVAREGAGG